MLPKKYRLKKRKEIEFVFKKGETVQDTFLKVKVAKRKDDCLKVAFIAPVGVFKKAVSRNKVKRLMSEAFKPHLENIPKGISIIFIAKEKILKKSVFELEKIIERNISKFNVLKNDK